MTDIVTPPTIDAMPPAPQPTDTREQFNLKAFPHAAAQQTMVTQVNASNLATHQNAVAADERAVAAGASASAASASAGTAGTKRDEAVAAATTATQQAGIATDAASTATTMRNQAAASAQSASEDAAAVADSMEAIAQGPVFKVNNKTGNVVLNAADVGAASAVNPTLAGAVAVTGSVRSGKTDVPALSVDCSLGNYFAKTINANSTFTFANPPAAGLAYTMRIDVNHTGGVITWPAAVKWPGNTAPTVTTGRVHSFLFATTDGGVTWRGAALTNYTG